MQKYRKFVQFVSKPNFIYPLLKLNNCLYFTLKQKFLEQFGFRIRELRLESGLSQEKLSFECDLDRTMAPERGNRNIATI